MASGFQGLRLDAESGNWYQRASYSSPVMQFTQRDKIGYDGGDMNLHGFVAQNPVRFVDPNGLWAAFDQAAGGVVEVGPFDAFDAAWGHYGDYAKKKSNEIARRWACDQQDYYAIQNAVRHAIWQAMLARDHGAGAAGNIGALHEAQANMSPDSRVDLKNNGRGRRIGERAAQRNLSDDQIADIVEAEMITGRLFDKGSKSRPNPIPLPRRSKHNPCPGKPSPNEKCQSSGSNDSSSGESSDSTHGSGDSSSYDSTFGSRTAGE